ncbi:probable G-protein coupled receptor 149 [Corythoichthys intestinalis]|uniref:probable G-protein coupled receptor 149 n=1 Tax=Corythoichthys intestinalis TaxID=161448 RepID=UPI0025A580FC|nr:probable G-protein coupled receptor 149 [Corythoichthys intestinalis]XP_061797003.1 probable G-protein coupled receptor 149 [Nerophis lumbriciformis]
MSTSNLNSSPPSHSYFSAATNGRTEVSAEGRVRLLLFAVCVTIAAATFVGGVYSLLSLLQMRRKTSLSLIVASMSVDDLLSVVPLSLFILLQWERDGGSATLCTLAGLLYVFQGVSSNMKACLIAGYTFYVTKRFGVLRSVRRPLRVMWAIAGVWAVSLAVSVLPLCGWGSFAQAPLGCFPESESFYTLLLFLLYSLCFCGLLFFFLPLTYQLLCSGEPQRSLQCAGYLADVRSLSRDSLDKSFGVYNELSPGSCETTCEIKEEKGAYVGSPASYCGPQSATVEDTPVVFAQKRFSMILAVVRVTLWMPTMTLMLVRHAANARSSSLETLGFFLTLLAPAITPLFVLSKRWIHMPCGCFINCNHDPTPDPSAMKRRFEFNLSLQKSCGVFKLSHGPISHSNTQAENRAYHSLFNSDFPTSRLDKLEHGGLCSLGPNFAVSARLPVDSSFHSDLLLEDVSSGGEALADCPPLSHEHHEGQEGFHDSPSYPFNPRERERHLTDTSSVFESSERRLSHEDGRKIELTDWEWCRSKSERTPRQRSSAGLSIPLCAFQGTVSLQAPTGKTLSLSTYEVSSDGLKISPNNAKKVEVYRSKSVGHEPMADDKVPGGQTGEVNISGVNMGLDIGMGIGAGVGDTNVKIHLEVLEICDNEEAMDSVSIVSNISQSSTHARSPSLRYSRRENRFVSCDLGETASYSLLIPTTGNPETEAINITIPDTVEAHRQNSRRQTQGSSGYQEEIQLLNEAYRKQSGDTDD